MARQLCEAGRALTFISDPFNVNLKPYERSFAAPELNCDLDVAGTTPERLVIRTARGQAGLRGAILPA